LGKRGGLAFRFGFLKKAADFKSAAFFVPHMAAIKKESVRLGGKPVEPSSSKTVLSQNYYFAR
jgi:hypothetical protein